MKVFVSSKWKALLTREGVDFEYLWGLRLATFDEPNTGRGPNGWSKASLFILPATGEQGPRLILKRQQNHFTRTWRHPVRGIPTLEKEFLNSLAYKRLGIPAIEPVYYAARRKGDAVQAILVTEFLEGYVSLERLAVRWAASGGMPAALRRRLIAAVARTVGKLHDCGFEHNCLTAKHVFVRSTGDGFEVRFIDLEKSRRRPVGEHRRLRDLETLLRRSQGWTRTDALRFLKAYFGGPRLEPEAVALCRRIARRTRMKTRRKSLKDRA